MGGPDATAAVILARQVEAKGVKAQNRMEAILIADRFEHEGARSAPLAVTYHCKAVDLEPAIGQSRADRHLAKEFGR